MKRFLLGLSLLLTLTFVGCSNNEKVEIKAPEVVIDWQALENLEGVEAFLQGQNVSLEGDYTPFYMNVTGDDVEELFILPETEGNIKVLTLDEQGQYQMINSTIQANKEAVISLDHDLIFVKTAYETPERAGLQYHLFKYLDGEIKQVVLEPIVISETKTVDYDLNTYEEVVSKIEFTNETDFTVTLTSDYIDEFGGIHPYRTIEMTGLFDENNKTYTVNKSDKSEFKTFSLLMKAIKTYGADESLLTFEEVFETEGLEAAINYYSDNRQNFVEGAKEAYADAIVAIIKEAIHYHRFNAKNMLDYVVVTEDHTISFPRKDGQLEANVQEIFAFYEKYKSSEEGIEADGYAVLYKNHDLSRKIYALTSDVSANTRTSDLLAYRIHADLDETTLIEKPVKIVSEEALNENHGLATLLIPLTLIDEPVEWIDMRDAKKGQKFGDVSVNYTKSDDDHFSFTLMSKSFIQGSIHSDRSSGLLFIEITTPALGHFKYPFDGKTFRTDVLTGIYTIQEYNIEETLGQEAVNLINKGETVQIEADVDMFVYSGYRGQLEVNDYPSVWIKNANLIEE